MIVLGGIGLVSLEGCGRGAAADEPDDASQALGDAIRPGVDERGVSSKPLTARARKRGWV